MDQRLEIRPGQEPVANRSRWAGSTRLLQPLACIICGILLVADHATRPTMHAAAPQVASSQLDGRGNRGQRKDDSEEWTDVQQWMQNHCINQWTFYTDKLADRPVAQQRAKKLMIEQYQRISSTKDPQMREALTNQASYRDNIFGVVVGYRRHEVNRVNAQKQIEVWADKLADIEIYIRVARINELKNEINDLQMRRKEYMARVSAKELQQADLPPGKLSATGDADVLQETVNPPTRRPGSTTRPANR